MRVAERLKEEVRKDLEALDAYEAEYGSFAEMVRKHYQPRTDDDVSEVGVAGVQDDSADEIGRD